MQDAGEFIPYAAKHRDQTRKSHSAESDVLSQLWPEPDWLELSSTGKCAPHTLAALAVTYWGLGTEPIQRGEIQKLLIAHKDRLMRFGFDLFDHLAKENGCEIVVMNQESHSPQQEMVEDLMAIVHTFSCRLYGMRKYKKKIQEDFAEYKIGQVRDDLQ
jgi:hypothetical protein